jgi:hypothetical protein
VSLPLQTVAELDQAPGQGQESDDQAEVEDVLHSAPPFCTGAKLPRFIARTIAVEGVKAR